ncbi:fibronectin type III domain-containing protein [Actinomadura sp. NBRC 104412]|uniref:fibronectin type III domain-containing protein n=1 Tax=Actinomadura sp. NBRC 104412 TaxID=3032203 RepID=UPI0025553263|nr:fibronectin type III domain-containing protein [Actinomadura sp. NBRC 104412]
MLALALLATVFGVGALGRTATVFDGSGWLWSSEKAQVSRVNAQTGEVDLRQPVPDSRGHRVTVTQNDRYLILHDLDTGRVTSVDLTSLGFSGRLDVGTRGSFHIALNDKDAFLIDRAKGEIRKLDPATLQPAAHGLRLPGPLVGGEFDRKGELWVASPGQGTAIGVRLTGDVPKVTHTVPVARPGGDLAFTVLDRGALAADRKGARLVVVDGENTREITSPVTLTDAIAPDRTEGSLAAVTVPPARAVVTIDNVLSGGDKAQKTLVHSQVPSPAVPFSGRLYVPDSEGRRVRVYKPGGPQVSVITIPGAGSRGGAGLELRIHDTNLFINDPSGPNAAAVTPEHQVRIVDKTEGPSTIGGEENRDPDPSDDRGAPSPPPQSSGPAPETPSTPSTSPSPAPPAPEGSDPPGAPVPVTALAGDRQVTLSWEAAYSPDAPVSSYRVTWNGGETTVAGDQLRTTVTGLTNGRAYRFRVAATNRFGTGAFAQSGQVTPAAARLDTPTGVSAEELANGVVEVSWDQVAGADQYIIAATNHTGGASYPTRTWGTSPVTYVNGRPKVQMSIAGMPDGSWTFTVVARSSSGVSSGTSAPSNRVVISTPSAPGNGGVTPVDPGGGDVTPVDPGDPGGGSEDVTPIDPGGGDIISVDPGGGGSDEPGMIPGHGPLDP